MKPFRTILLPAALLALAACSSSSSSTAATAKAPTGTETFTSGRVTSAKVLESNNPVIHLTYTGPVYATGTFDLGGAGPQKGQTKTFVTSKGNLVLQVVSDSQSSKLLTTRNCLAQQVTTVHYTVDGAKSTGSFKGASGHGVVTAAFTSNSELDHKCSLAQNSQPANTKGAYVQFTGSGPLTLAS